MIIELILFLFLGLYFFMFCVFWTEVVQKIYRSTKTTITKKGFSIIKGDKK